VTVDYLITSKHDEKDRKKKEDDPEKALRRKRKHAMITGMSVILVWVIATVLFIVLDVALKDTYAHFLAFAYAVPVSCIVWLVFNSLWHNRRWNFAIISLMVWTLLASVHLSVIAGGINLWQIYLIGIPGQIIILLWSKIGKRG
jgi:cation transport ATPase